MRIEPLKPGSALMLGQFTTQYEAYPDLELGGGYFGYTAPLCLSARQHDCACWR
jgi:hypothetical protein